MSWHVSAFLRNRGFKGISYYAKNASEIFTSNACLFQKQLLLYIFCIFTKSKSSLSLTLILFLISQKIRNIDLCFLAHRAERLCRCRLRCFLRSDWLCRCCCRWCTEGRCLVGRLRCRCSLCCRLSVCIASRLCLERSLELQSSLFATGVFTPWESSPVAITVIVASSCAFSSYIAPKMILASSPASSCT